MSVVGLVTEASPFPSPLAFGFGTYGLGAITPPVAVLLLEGKEVGVFVICPRPDAPIRPDQVPPLREKNAMENPR